MQKKQILLYLLYVNGSSRQRWPHHAALARICLTVDDERWEFHYAPDGCCRKCFMLRLTRAEWASRWRWGRSRLRLRSC